MDPGVIAVLIPIVAIVSVAAVKVARILASARAPGPDPGTQARLADLEEAVGSMRRELEETQERLDFAERILAQPRADKLSPPS